MRKQLVTWSLVLPFSFSTLAFADRVILSDQLLFRLNNRAIFFLDIIDYAAQLKTFSCLYPKSTLLNYDQLQSTDWDQFKKIAPNSDLNPHRELILKLKSLLMRQIYANAQSMSVEKDFERKLPLSRCSVGPFATWPEELQSLVQAELFWSEIPAGEEISLESVRSLIEHEVLF